MKTTVNIDDTLIQTAMDIYGIKTKTAIIEMGLKELIEKEKRKKLVDLFGSEKNIKAPSRRRTS